MPRRIRITVGDVALEGELDDSATAGAVWEALPLEARGHRWGDEVYFAIPVHRALEGPGQVVMEVGDLAYWPPGRAFCLFFGPTPASAGREPRAASAVARIGRVTGDATALARVPDGAPVRVERAQ